jgi:hypothetical protein
MIVAKFCPEPRPPIPKGAPGPCPKPLPKFKPPPAEVMAEFPVLPKGILETSRSKPPPVPVQFIAKVLQLTFLGLLRQKLPQLSQKSLIRSAMIQLKLLQLTRHGALCLNSGVKKLAILLSPEVRHRIEGYREGHTYNVEEMDTLIDVSRAMIAAARKCKEIRWKFLDQIFELLESRKAVFGTCNWRFYFSERVRVLRPIRGRNSFSLARPDQKHCYCPARRH